MIFKGIELTMCSQTKHVAACHALRAMNTGHLDQRCRSNRFGNGALKQLILVRSRLVPASRPRHIAHATTCARTHGCKHARNQTGKAGNQPEITASTVLVSGCKKSGQVNCSGRRPPLFPRKRTHARTQNRTHRSATWPIDPEASSQL